MSYESPLHAIHELLAALRNAVRPANLGANLWQWDSYFDTRLAIIERAATAPAAKPTTVSSKSAKSH